MSCPMELYQDDTYKQRFKGCIQSLRPWWPVGGRFETPPAASKETSLHVKEPLRHKAPATSRIKVSCNRKAMGERIFQELWTESVSVLNKFSRFFIHFLVRIKYDSRKFSYLKISSSGGERPSSTILEYKWHLEVQNRVFLLSSQQTISRQTQLKYQKSRNGIPETVYLFLSFN